MAYHELSDPRTNKAPDHQANALRNKGNDLSNANIVPAKNSNNLIRKYPTHSYLLYNALFDYCRDHFNIGDDVIIKIIFKKFEGSGYSGHVNLGLDTNVIYVDDVNILLIMKHILHEFTHINQKLNEGLKGVKINKRWYISWKGEPVISKTDYSKLSPQEHDKLPFEEEAESNIKLLPRFFKSSYYKNLKGQDSTLDFLIENDLMPKIKEKSKPEVVNILSLVKANKMEKQ